MSFQTEVLRVPPRAFGSNGDAFASHNKIAKADEEIETEFPVSGSYNCTGNSTNCIESKFS
jgi:hypothetical protein